MRFKSQHAFSPGCPKVVYFFEEKGVLRVVPNRVQLRIGQGLGWVSLGELGDFNVDFETECPFKARHFDQDTPGSGPARRSASAPYICTIRCGSLSADLQIVVDPLPVGAALEPKRVDVSLRNNQIVVNPHKVGVWSDLETVEWHGEGANDVTITFKNNDSPFVAGDPSPGHPAKSSMTKNDVQPWPHKYEYTINYRGKTLDPDVVVDPPDNP